VHHARINGDKELAEFNEFFECVNACFPNKRNCTRRIEFRKNRINLMAFPLRTAEKQNHTWIFKQSFAKRNPIFLEPMF
jgi:hypothetical protein